MFTKIWRLIMFIRSICFYGWKAICKSISIDSIDFWTTLEPRQNDSNIFQDVRQFVPWRRWNSFGGRARERPWRCWADVVWRHVPWPPDLFAEGSTNGRLSSDCHFISTSIHQWNFGLWAFASGGSLDKCFFLTFLCGYSFNLLAIAHARAALNATNHNANPWVNRHRKGPMFEQFGTPPMQSKGVVSPNGPFCRFPGRRRKPVEDWSYRGITLRREHVKFGANCKSR